MLNLVSLVSRLVPGLLDHSCSSVACVCTTRPKYLVFNGDATKPACVVEFGAAERLTRIDWILSELHGRMPHAVPRPIYCAPWQSGSYVLIQEGRAGLPWFRVSDGLENPSDWWSLLDRAVSVMLGLHTAAQATPAWTGTIHVGAELEHQAAVCCENGTRLSTKVRERVTEWSRSIGAADPMRTVWQHGDFSLNNLLVTDESIAIIDFDEYGGTLVPLHDAFGLALSVPLTQNGRCPLSMADCISACVGPARREAAIAQRHLPALLMHHLLWRLNQANGLERRAALARILTGWIEDLARDPELFLGQVD